MCGLTSIVRALASHRRGMKGMALGAPMPTEWGLGHCLCCGSKQSKRTRCEMRWGQVVCKDCCIGDPLGGHQCVWWDLCW